MVTWSFLPFAVNASLSLSIIWHFEHEHSNWYHAPQKGSVSVAVSVRYIT